MNLKQYLLSTSSLYHQFITPDNKEMIEIIMGAYVKFDKNQLRKQIMTKSPGELNESRKEKEDEEDKIFKVKIKIKNYNAET